MGILRQSILYLCVSVDRTQAIKSTKTGWTIGGGVEYALPASNWSAKFEYLYADLGTAPCDIAHCATPSIASSIDTSFHANVVRIGVNYRY